MADIQVPPPAYNAHPNAASSPSHDPMIEPLPGYSEPLFPHHEARPGDKQPPVEAPVVDLEGQQEVRRAPAARKKKGGACCGWFFIILMLVLCAIWILDLRSKS